MSINNYFNLNRFWLLLKNDFLVNRQTIFTTAAAIAGVLFLYGIISPSGAMGDNFHAGAYFLLLYVGGVWTTSLAFRDLHDKQKNYAILTLPCSTLEKLLSKLVLTSVGYIVGTVILFWLVSIIVVAINAWFFTNNLHIFNPFQQKILLHMRGYLIIQSIYFLGSIYFRKNVITKTVLVLVTLFIFLSILLFFIFMLAFGPFGLAAFVHYIVILFSSVFWLILAFCCWFIAYIRLREIEV